MFGDVCSENAPVGMGARVGRRPSPLSASLQARTYSPSTLSSWIRCIFVLLLQHWVVFAGAGVSTTALCSASATSHQRSGPCMCTRSSQAGPWGMRMSCLSPVTAVMVCSPLCVSCNPSSLFAFPWCCRDQYYLILPWQTERINCCD